MRTICRRGSAVAELDNDILSGLESIGKVNKGGQEAKILVSHRGRLTVLMVTSRLTREEGRFTRQLFKWTREISAAVECAFWRWEGAISGECWLVWPTIT